MLARALKFKCLLICAIALSACARPGTLSSSVADADAAGIVAGKMVETTADRASNQGAIRQTDGLARSTVLLLMLSRQEKSIRLIAVCSGSLITRELVLTAAHCLNRAGAEHDPIDADSVLVDFGNYREGDALNDQSTVPVRAIRLHDEFSLWRSEHGLQGHDLALLRLQGPLPQGYAPASILPHQHSLKLAQRAVVAGFGNPSMTGSFDREDLRRYDGYSVSATAGTSSVVRLKSDVSGGIADGDSGGPAFVVQGGELKLWGVASSSYTGDHEEAFYEDLRASRAWLQRASAELGSALKQP